MSAGFQQGITRVYLAGLHGSEPGHWQSRWHAQDPGSVWIQHRDWERPDLGAWLADVDDALAGRPGPKLLVAHSLGCYLAAAWASMLRPRGLLGAFLVAPPDLSQPGLAGVARGFEAGTSLPLACHGALVASQDDPWAGFEVSRLSRLRYGTVELPRDLRPGQWRLLDDAVSASL